MQKKKNNKKPKNGKIKKMWVTNFLIFVLLIYSWILIKKKKPRERWELKKNNPHTRWLYLTTLCQKIPAHKKKKKKKKI